MTTALHDPLPHQHWVYTNHTYQARCSCGWTSTDLESREAADAALANHQNETENPS